MGDAIFQQLKMYSPFLILGPNTEAVYSDKNLVDLDENFAIQKEPAMLCDQNPEQSKRNHNEDERRGKKKWKEREGEEKEVEVEERLEEEQEKEEKNEEQYPQKRLVSKPLMDTLWATFKLNKCPTKGDSQSLAFEFNMTAKQV
ncbi:NANOG neighbor homeobox [Leptonychotes weddellii]|uniref:NANOG neighbor homeobox n=1 Tax=Leptonychotes weddellii TaxID=9713 RepID=A0A7F8R801_LEPWE|nr:NANOG neighbor homeobox [Leptonychotes weddellii]